MTTSANDMLAGKKVCVVGHRGMVGSALVRRLQGEPCEILGLGRNEADLRRQDAVESFFHATKPQIVFLAAAKVGGIAANSQKPADFLFDNLMIETNVIDAARQVGVEKLVFLGSSCIYPKHAPQPICEDDLLTGPLEPTNEWYAVAKIAGIKLCQAYRRQHGCDFISAQPTNLYGPGDNYDLESSHVVPALIRKAHEARISGARHLTIWGSGSPLREFLYVDDLADALVFLARHYSDEAPINVGSGHEVSIRELALRIKEIVGFEGELRFDSTRPDGTPRKLLDRSKLTGLGWSGARPLARGLTETYRAFCSQHSAGHSSSLAAA